MDVVAFDRRVLAQESNSIRLAALFAFVTAVFLLILTQLFNFSNRSSSLALLSAPHLVLAPIAIFVSVMSGWWAKITVPFFILQLVLDTIELALRIFPLTSETLLELRTIGELLFIFISVGLVIIDVVYLAFIYRYFTSYDAAVAASIIGAGGADEMDYFTPPEEQSKEQYEVYTEATNTGARATARRGGVVRMRVPLFLDAHRIDARRYAGMTPPNGL